MATDYGKSYEHNIKAEVAAKARYAGDSGLAAPGLLMPTCDTVKSRLKYALANHQQRAQECERLLSLLERNPDIEEILNLTRSLL